MTVAMQCEVCALRTDARRLRDGSALTACTACGHVVRDLAASPAHHRSEAYGGDPRLDRVRLGLTMRALDRHAGSTPRAVFEIGFGAGELLRRYLDRGARVAGCDPDQLGNAVDPIVVQSAALQPVPLEEAIGDGTSDLVLGIHVIEHVRDVTESLDACHRLLAPGGRLALFTPAADSWSLSVFSQAWWLLEDPTHVRFFTRRSIRRALHDAGFVNVRVRRLLADNLTMEGASLVRAVRPAERERGVLGTSLTRWVSMACIPLALVLRLLPRWRPTILVTAAKPRG